MESHFPIDPVECVKSINKQDAFGSVTLKGHTHGMNSSFAAAFLTSAELNRASGILDVRANHCEDSLSNDSSWYLSHPNTANPWTFVERYQATHCER